MLTDRIAIMAETPIVKGNWRNRVRVRSPYTVITRWLRSKQDLQLQRRIRAYTAEDAQADQRCPALFRFQPDSYA